MNGGLKNDKSWILKALYEAFVSFLKFLFQICTQIIVFLTNQSHTFFVLSVMHRALIQSKNSFSKYGKI